MASCGGAAAADRLQLPRGLLPQPAISSAGDRGPGRSGPAAAACCGPHGDFMTCSAALDSSAANDDSVLVGARPWVEVQLGARVGRWRR